MRAFVNLLRTVVALAVPAAIAAQIRAESLKHSFKPGHFF